MAEQQGSSASEAVGQQCSEAVEQQWNTSNSSCSSRCNRRVPLVLQQGCIITTGLQQQRWKQRYWRL